MRPEFTQVAEWGLVTPIQTVAYAVTPFVLVNTQAVVAAQFKGGTFCDVSTTFTCTCITLQVYQIAIEQHDIKHFDTGNGIISF